jgi:hypothetical protein
VSNRGVRSKQALPKSKKPHSLSHCVDPSESRPALPEFRSGLDYPQSASTRIDELRINMVRQRGMRFERSLLDTYNAQKDHGVRHEQIAESSFVPITQVWGKIEAVRKKRGTFSKHA